MHHCLQNTAWLAKRLGLSVSTIERLRSSQQGELPPHIVIGRKSIRYDEAVVESWLKEQQQMALPVAASAAPAPNELVTSKPIRKALFKKKII